MQTNVTTADIKFIKKSLSNSNVYYVVRRSAIDAILIHDIKTLEKDLYKIATLSYIKNYFSSTNKTKYLRENSKKKFSDDSLYILIRGYRRTLDGNIKYYLQNK